MDVIINKAKAQAEADIQRNDANMESLSQNIKLQAMSFKGLKDSLALDNASLLKYIRQQVISEYD